VIAAGYRAGIPQGDDIGTAAPIIADSGTGAGGQHVDPTNAGTSCTRCVAAADVSDHAQRGPCLQGASVSATVHIFARQRIPALFECDLRAISGVSGWVRHTSGIEGDPRSPRPLRSPSKLRDGVSVVTTVDNLGRRCANGCTQPRRSAVATRRVRLIGSSQIPQVITAD